MPQTAMPILTEDEKKTLSVLAFLFFRLGMEDRARRFYETIAELSAPGTPDFRVAKAGLAAAALEAGDAETALREVREALAGGPLSTRDATLHWLRSRALWALGRKEEARAARETFLSMRGDAFPTEDEDAAKVQ